MVTTANLAEPGPHALAVALAERLRAATQAGAPRETPAEARRVLLLGVGSGRNVPVLLGAGACVDAVEADVHRAGEARRRWGSGGRFTVVNPTAANPIPFPPGFACALSTHALLHGTPAQIESLVAQVRERLQPGAPFYTTLGSKRDPRFGAGRRVGADAFAPLDGSEAGVAHAYFDERGVLTLFAKFALEALVETDVGETVGRWAHGEQAAADIVHWYVRARKL